MRHAVIAMFVVFAFSTLAEGQYTIVHQEAPDDVPYPRSFLSKKLPNSGRGGPIEHLMANSDKIVAETLGYALQDGGHMAATKFQTAPSNNEGAQEARYYATAKDPVYKVMDTTVPQCKGRTFHAPNEAEFSSNCMGKAGCSTYDSEIFIWDQATDEIFQFFKGLSKGQYSKLPACPDGRHAGTERDPCAYYTGNGYCGVDNRAAGKGYNGGNTNTNGLSPMAGGIRFEEMMSGHIKHALYTNTLCTADRTVFPASIGGWPARTCADYRRRGNPSFSYAFRPPNGSLIFLDYTDAQLACFKHGCPGIPKLPDWQYPLVEAYTYYGGYVGDTGEGPQGIFLSQTESAQSYYYYTHHGFADAYARAQSFFNWLDRQCSPGTCERVNRRTPGPQTQWNLFWLDGIPANIPGPTCYDWKAKKNECGPNRHLHIADECVARKLAGEHGDCVFRSLKRAGIHKAY